MSPRELLLTFDHELFLGSNSGTPERCLLQPAEAVATIMERYGLKGVFFVDATYLMRMEELAPKYARVADDLGRIDAQLRSFVQRGHEVHPHIHPHWMDAVYDERTNTWDLSNSTKYRFAVLDGSQRQAVFAGAMKVLKRSLGEAGSAHPIDAFRAGGWCIQPFMDFRPFFEHHGIRCDMSVLAGIKRSTRTLRYDFTAPVPGPIYRFGDDVMQPELDGPFIELAISRVHLRANALLDDLVNKVLWRIPQGHQAGDGKGVLFVDLEEASSDTDRRRVMLSIELLNLIRLPSFVRHVEEHAFSQFISHPKMFSPHHLSTFDRLLDKLKRRFELRSDWRAYAARVLGGFPQA
ncbi:MAG: hypothetical protein QM724_07435 [Flavobacteriales bacterium]